MVTIIARPLPSALTDFVKRLGYSVVHVPTPRFPPQEGILVWFVEETSEPTVNGFVESWLATDRVSRVVLVCRDAIEIRARVDDPRVWVMAAPLSPDELADVLHDVRREFA